MLIQVLHLLILGTQTKTTEQLLLFHLDDLDRSRNSGQLKSIRVEECSASREEDKAAILAKIGGKDGREWCHDFPPETRIATENIQVGRLISLQPRLATRLLCWSRHFINIFSIKVGPGS